MTPPSLPSSLLAQLNALQAKHEALLKAQSSASSPPSTAPLDTVLPLYSALLTPLQSMTASSPFMSGPSSPLLVDGLLGSLNRCREIRGSMPLVLLHLKALDCAGHAEQGLCAAHGTEGSRPGDGGHYEGRPPQPHCPDC